MFTLPLPEHYTDFTSYRSCYFLGIAHAEGPSSRIPSKPDVLSCVYCAVCSGEQPRPVVLLGAPQAVTALRTHLLKEYDKVFCTCPVCKSAPW